MESARALQRSLTSSLPCPLQLPMAKVPGRFVVPHFGQPNQAGGAARRQRHGNGGAKTAIARRTPLLSHSDTCESPRELAVTLSDGPSIDCASAGAVIAAASARCCASRRSNRCSGGANSSNKRPLRAIAVVVLRKLAQRCFVANLDEAD